MNIFDDIRNIKKVMVGDISLADHTALFCVHKHMIRVSKARVPIIREYQTRLSRFISDIFLRFTLTSRYYWEEYYHRLDMEFLEAQKDVASWRENRPRRQRKAPKRLNITTTRTKSYG